MTTIKEELDTKQSCTMCHKSELIKLPNEFQIYARRKKFVSYFCTHCIQIVNFMD